MRFQHGFQWSAAAPGFKNGSDLLSRFWLILAAAALLALTGCATTRPAASSFVRQQSQALSPDTPTPLAASFAAARAAHPGESGFHLLIQGKEALAARIALARSATRTLDIQYYIANEDNTGKLLLEAAVRAAERGVRVRMLIDDMNFKDIDSTMAVLNSTPNIEIRVFNPFATHDEGALRRMGNVVTHLDTLTRRMHNKAMIADNQASITGGRNVGDEYFDASPSITFRDIDILSVGPIVPDISRSFDIFWNSEESYPLKALNNQRFKAAKIAKVRSQLRQHWEEMSTMTGGADLDEPPLARQIRTGQTPLVWAKATFFTDTPRKIITPTDDYVSPPTQRIWQLADQSSQSFILISPYFVPHNDSIDHLGAMVANGVHVSVLTNSLAATDAPAVQAGYAPARVPLLKRGVALYEFKAINGEHRPGLIGSHSRASLHAKAYVFDNKILLIGSPNLDPRSAGLNTEMAIEVDSPILAAQVTDLFDKAASLDESYHVTLADRDALSQTGSSGAPPSPLIWTTRDHGQLQTYNFDPDAGLWRNVLTGIFFILPLKNQL
ncbi:phospholipase D family protein [Robbsia sp. KACC 23696]|uniref:phospholipase D family protein n=1 Tax=Robbsia sp. KACC 23696 TaxID=3149231 RepID=UPI00325A9F30